MTAVRLVSAGVVASLLGVALPARAQENPATLTPDGLAWRTRGGELTLSPGGRLQVDGAFFSRQEPKSGLYIRRAILELRGWVGDTFTFVLGGDFAPGPPPGVLVAPSELPAADDYLAYAPFGDALIAQAGQFDAPFTLENRTSDVQTDFIERAMVARSLGAPRNKDIGVMVHGLLGSGRFYYSAGIFNGEGPAFRNLDNQADVMGRLVWAPFAAGDSGWRRAWVGASGWHGNHVLGPEAPVQATPGGVVFFQPQWTVAGGTTIALHEQGTIAAVAGELNVPIGDRFGVRGELVWKKQNLVEAGVTGDTISPAANATLDGIAGYGEAWFWLLGDQRQLPAPGYQLPVRPAGSGAPLLEDALMVAVRGEILKEDLNSSAPSLGDPGIATTRVESGTAGVNYWRGRFVRVSANYVLNHWSGTSETILALMATGRFEHEVLIRFALSM